MVDWTPPAHGSPCWIEIPAVDVRRAKAFYSNVFNWQFRTHEGTPEDDMVGFAFPEKNLGSLTGGITKVEENKHTKGHRAVKLYLYVDDLEKTIAEIVKNGGKRCSEIEPEGDFGLMIQFDDCEGNHSGIYTMKHK